MSDIDEMLMVLLPDENNPLENHNKRLRKYAKQTIEAEITKARIDEIKKADHRFTNPYLGKDKFQAYVQERIAQLKEQTK